MAFSVKTPLMVAMFGLSIGLTGCGGDGSSSASYDGSGNNGNGNTTQTVLKMSQFSSEDDDKTDQLSGISRQDYTVGDGQFSVIEKTIWGKITSSDEVQYTVADNFFIKNSGNDFSKRFKNANVTQPSNDMYVMEFDMLGENNQVIHEAVSFKTIDISGNFNFAEKRKQGYDFDMGFDENKLPTSVVFPTGSVCYAEYQDKVSKPTYYFDEDYATNYTSLESFMADNNITPATSSLSFVGTNNQLPLLTYRLDNDTHYAILFNGKVYDDIQGISSYTANLDPSKDTVYCDFIDTKAGDALEQELRKMYK